MARIRSVKPEYWTSEQVMAMSRGARLLFIGLWNFSDDGGNHPASPKTLKAEVLPGDDDITSDRIMELVDEMIEQGLVEEYESGGKIYWHVTGWKKHQRIDQPTYRHPTGDAGDAGDTRVTRVTKRLGGKQRQLALKKLRDRDGDACHLCGDSSNLSIFSDTPENAENPHDISLLRLICATCKRNHKRSDTQNTQGDAGDAKPLDGDSPTEWSGEERSGVEGNGESLPPTAAHRTSNGVGDANTESAASTTRIGQICILLRRHGINTSPQNLSTHAWATNPAVTDELLATAMAKAKQQKPNGLIHPNYLKPIIEDLLNPIEVKPRKADDWAWKRSDAGISRKGEELGMRPRGTESYKDYADRIEAEILKRKGKAA